MIKQLNSYEEVTAFLETSGLRSLYFSTTTCQTCHVWLPLVEAYYTDLKLDLGKVNLMDLPKLARELNVLGVPALVAFADGVELERFSNQQSKTEIISALKQLV